MEYIDNNMSFGGSFGFYILFIVVIFGILISQAYAFGVISHGEDALGPATLFMSIFMVAFGASFFGGDFLGVIKSSFEEAFRVLKGENVGDTGGISLTFIFPILAAAIFAIYIYIFSILEFCGILFGDGVLMVINMALMVLTILLMLMTLVVMFFMAIEVAITALCLSIFFGGGSTYVLVKVR